MMTSANLRTKILNFRGFDSSIILILRDGIPRPIGNFPEISSQRILLGRFLVGRLGVPDLRKAVQRGRKVNRLGGKLNEQLHERHDAIDFDLNTQDKISS